MAKENSTNISVSNQSANLLEIVYGSIKDIIQASEQDVFVINGKSSEYFFLLR